MRSDGRSTHPRPRETRTLNGVPEVKNKNGKFVPDQKALKATRDAAHQAQIAEELSTALDEQSTAPPSTLIATEQHQPQVRFDSASRASSRKQAITAVLSRLRPS